MPPEAGLGGVRVAGRFLAEYVVRVFVAAAEWFVFSLFQVDRANALFSRGVVDSFSGPGFLGGGRAG